MNVFVLSTGRCGSTTFARACLAIDNFSSAHESNWGKLGPARLEYPSRHIEVDNRLSWMLGTLDKRYGNNAYYVHLSRDPEAVARSFAARWDLRVSIIRAFAHDILARDEQSIDVARAYVACVNDNIDLFLRDKLHVMRIELDSIEEDFRQFWSWIGATGEWSKALASLQAVHNATVLDTTDAHPRGLSALVHHFRKWRVP